MSNNGVLRGKKIFLVSEDENIIQNINESLLDHNPNLFYGKSAKEAVANIMAKNPDLVIYDDKMPDYHGLKVLSMIKRAKPKTKVLLLAPEGVPLRSIDVSAQGVSHTIQRNSSKQQIYNAVKHCLAIASVPRVESMA